MVLDCGSGCVPMFEASVRQGSGASGVLHSSEAGRGLQMLQIHLKFIFSTRDP